MSTIVKFENSLKPEEAHYKIMLNEFEDARYWLMEF